jgi:hypothetical protein
MEGDTKVNCLAVPGESGLVYCSRGFGKLAPHLDSLFILFISRGGTHNWEYCGDYRVWFLKIKWLIVAISGSFF